MEDSGAITVLLQRFQEGDDVAQNELMQAVQGELRVIASRYMRREKVGHTLQTTALVNEAYLKLVNVKTASWQDRAHFFAVAAQIMRRILVDHARQHIAGKRGGGMEALPLNEALVFAPEKSGQLIELDEALKLLEQRDPRAGQVIELRFFGGLSVEESAEVMKVSPRTVRREWTFARAWLREQLGLQPEQDGSDA
ncbi:MAG: sigma-70 family RNA polymerase sigma factor [Bryobacteraceae bacterium]|nr:sigma-70 family RNA polymerase sigma factor [Bryobacteraceae bacterium]